MTQEKNCFVSPEDILAVRFRCGKCKAASIVPIERLIKAGSFVNELSRDCAYCGTSTGLNPNGQEFVELADFNVLLGKLAAILKGRNIQFSLQIECGE